MPPIDFKVRQDAFGYYVIAYKIVAGIESRYETSDAMSILLNLKPSELNEYLQYEYGGEMEVKNKRVHFSSFQDAMTCCNGLRDLIPKAIATGNLYIV